MYSLNGCPEKDALQINMEIISKELNDLVVTHEKDCGTVVAENMQHSGYQNVICSIPPKFAGTQCVNNSQQIPYMFATQYHLNANSLGDTYMNHCSTSYESHPLPQGNANNITASNAPCFSTSGYSGPALNSAYTTPVGYAPMQPYRRQQMNADKINSPPLLSIAATDNLNGPHSASGGSYKKFVKPNTRFNMMSKNHDYDYKNIVVDLSALGIRKDGKEPNLVLRLFGLFRDLHIAIGEQPPIIEPPTSNESVYVPTFAPLPKIVLPCTMSVQCQVKYATTQVATFLCAMKRLMAVNIVYDHNLNAECELYIIKLRQMLAQFEMYKFVELKHKRGQFINESVRVHAEHLEKIMEQMNHQIREVNLRVIAADWFIAKKYGRTMGVTPKAATKPADLPYTTDNGVINEILQFCAPTANAKETGDGLDKTANGVTQINSANAELPRAAAVDKHAATTAVGATCLTKFNGHPAHNRQPVFYIG